MRTTLASACESGRMQVVEDESALPPANPVFGVGTVPLALDRINWGALVLGPLWALGYGAWGWCVGLIAARVVPFALFYLVPASRRHSHRNHLVGCLGFVLRARGGIRVSREPARLVGGSSRLRY
jgi:hypothetical protein